MVAEFTAAEDGRVHDPAQLGAQRLQDREQVGARQTVAHNHEIDIAAAGIGTLADRPEYKGGPNARHQGQQCSAQWLGQTNGFAGSPAQFRSYR